MASRRVLLAPCIRLVAFAPLWLVGGLYARQPVDFSRDVAPILELHCIRCHQPANKKSGLSLATFADLKSNEYVTPGDPDVSYLIEVVTAAGGEKPLMPKDGAPLSAKEV